MVVGRVFRPGNSFAMGAARNRTLTSLSTGHLCHMTEHADQSEHACQSERACRSILATFAAGGTMLGVVSPFGAVGQSQFPWPLEACHSPHSLGRQLFSGSWRCAIIGMPWGLKRRSMLRKHFVYKKAGLEHKFMLTIRSSICLQPPDFDRARG